MKQPGKSTLASKRLHAYPLLPLLFYMLTLAVLAGSVTIATLKTYQRTVTNTEKRLEARADLAAGLVANRFLSVRNVLKTLAVFVEPAVVHPSVMPGIRQESLDRLLDKKVNQLGFIETLFVTDTDGRILFSSTSQASERIAAWPFLASQMSQNRSQSHVTQVHQAGGKRNAAIWQIRELHNGRGQTIALIIAKSSARMIIDPVARLSLAQGQSIAILDTAMRLVARLPNPNHAPRPVSGVQVEEPYTEKFLKKGLEKGNAVTHSPIDGVERFYVFKRLSESPYLIVVGEKTEVALRDWRQSAWIAGSGTLAAAILGWLFLRQYYRLFGAREDLKQENQMRQSLQQKAQANEARLKALVSAIPDIVLVLDSDGFFRLVQAKDESQLLKPADELLGRHYGDILPDEVSHHLDYAQKVLRDENQSERFDYSLVLEGEVRNFEATITRLQVVNGEGAGFLTIVRDITRRKRQEAELRIASTAFQAHVGMLITDPDTRIIRANPAFTRMTGYTEQEVKGQTPQILHSGLQDKAFYTDFWARLDQTGRWEGEIWNRRKDGTTFAEWLTVSAVTDPDGTITNYVAIFHDITRRKEAERTAHRLTFYDSLTGLANPALLADRIAETCKINSREKKSAALLYLDVQHFRDINDARGHKVGDAVLQCLAERLKTSVRETDTLARMGSDEFAVLLNDLPESTEIAAHDAEQVASKVLRELNMPFETAGLVLHVEVSIGVTIIGAESIAPDVHIQRAEQAMNQAKQELHHGKPDPVAFFNPDIQARVVEQVMLEEELRQALDKGELVLFYQPQIQHPDELTGYEVLLRWQHPKRGMVSPGSFIPIAEQSRQIIPIGEWVLQQACQCLGAWHAAGEKATLSLAVNVSVVQFQTGDFVDQIDQILKRTGAPPHQLKLEVTESLLMDDPGKTTAIMKRLRSLGIRFSLDDYGTGYSSLRYLNQLPLDQLKIDQSFIRDLTVSETSAAIVQSTIGLARGLGLDIIAEGVETEEQRAWLVDHGCTQFQGYLFGRPAPLDESHRAHLIDE